MYPDDGVNRSSVIIGLIPMVRFLLDTATDRNIPRYKAAVTLYHGQSSIAMCGAGSKRKAFLALCWRCQRHFQEHQRVIQG